MNRSGAVPRSVRGLTLVELMVVVAIMAILASVVYPLYATQVQKTRRADARIAAESVALAQERFYTLNGFYTNDLGLLQVSAAIRGGGSDEGHYDIAVVLPGGNNQQFVVTAAPAAAGLQTGDAECTSFTVNQLGVKQATGSKPDSCW